MNQRQTRIRNNVGYGLTLFALLALGAVSCKKYAMQGNISHAAYLRVFNDIPFTVNFINQDQPVPFFTLLIDPQIGADGIPTGGKIVGDYLGTRQLYNTSYASNEGNSLNASLDTSIHYNLNYEYPGSAHVLTAPSLDGLDLSAWAQVPSGQHRVMFISRPQNSTPFASLSDSIRHRVLIDTTVTFQPGQVYTMEALLMNIDVSTYGIYLRQENFMNQAFDANKDYVSFYNLSSVKSVFSGLPLSPSTYYFPDTMNIYYTYYTFNNAGNPTNLIDPFYPLTGFNGNFIGSIDGMLQGNAPYYSLPVLPVSYFYDAQGNLRSQDDTTYYSGSSNYFIGPTTPYFVFTFLSPGDNATPANQPGAGSSNISFTLTCNIDPTLFNNPNNNYNQNYGSPSSANSELMANLNMLVTNNNTTYVYPAIYQVELVNNIAYVMQVQKLLQ
jgi:hypothetical protein